MLNIDKIRKITEKNKDYKIRKNIERIEYYIRKSATAGENHCNYFCDLDNENDIKIVLDYFNEKGFKATNNDKLKIGKNTLNNAQVIEITW